jgi:transcriptional regulator with XRE-family HTH domain
VAVLAQDAIPNIALYNFRDGLGLSQQEVADGLNGLARSHDKHWSCTVQSVSRWERGVVTRPDPLARRLLAEFFNVSIEELGFTRPRLHADSGVVRGFSLNDLADVPHSLDPRVERSQEDWRATRDALNTHRNELNRIAGRLYEPKVRMGRTGLILHPDWAPKTPVDLMKIKLEMRTAEPATLTGGEPQAANMLPLATAATRYHRYSHAMRDLAGIGLFENRLSYRLLGVDWSDSGGQLTFGHTTYFEMVDFCELIAHETTLAHLSSPSENASSVSQPSWRRLPFRKLLGDPFDMIQRPILPSIDTLTIRRSKTGSPSIVLHRRDATKVATAGGMLHIMPAGIFQPSSVLPASQAADFDLWRNVMREYSEEFLGNPEHDGDGAPINYEQTEPFTSLDQARQDGRLRIYCFGIAIDALTLACEILTVAVIDEDVYDDVFAKLVETNSEGTIVTTVPFEEHTVRQLLAGKQHALAPAAAGCIDLAWQHRSTLLCQ